MPLLPKSAIGTRVPGIQKIPVAQPTVRIPLQLEILKQVQDDERGRRSLDFARDDKLKLGRESLTRAVREFYVDAKRG